ncbi:MAG: hypothetical protein KJT03_21695 [Verrucomicrobiae bacterium]|nr:hypothetical protein [Verrucomicrobiae bacterium]
MHIDMPDVAALVIAGEALLVDNEQVHAGDVKNLHVQTAVCFEVVTVIAGEIPKVSLFR